MSDEPKRARAEVLADALLQLLDHYVVLANCGDCGFWDPEKEPQVIAARAALALMEGPDGWATLENVR